MNLTEIKNLVKKRQETLKAEGRAVKLGHLYEEYALEQGFKNWAICKAKASRKTSTKPKTFKDTLESLFLDESAQGWANTYYDYQQGTQVVVQVEAWQEDSGEWIFNRNDFSQGTGAHTRDYWDAEGPKFCVHIESSSGFDQESYTPEESLDHYFSQHFGTGISQELKDWVAEVRQQELELHNTWELDQLIRDSGSIVEVETARIALKGAYNLDLIQDKIDEEFPEDPTKEEAKALFDLLKWDQAYLDSDIKNAGDPSECLWKMVSTDGLWECTFSQPNDDNEPDTYDWSFDNMDSLSRRC